VGQSFCSDCKPLRPRTTCQTHLLANGGKRGLGPPSGCRAYQERIGVRVSAGVPWQALIVARIDLMNPSGVMASFLSTRVLKIATLSLSLVSSAVVSVHAQTQQPPRPAAREAARPAPTQGFLGWLRQFAPTPRNQSRGVPFPPLPRSRPAEPTSTPVEQMSEPVQSDQTQTPAEPAPAPDEPTEGPLND
jgi:hypothetical protein